MQKIIIISLAIFLFLNLPATIASDHRLLQSTGYGAPSSSGSSSQNSSSSSGSSSSSSGSSYAGGYTPSYEEEYEQEQQYEEQYEEQEQQYEEQEEQYEEQEEQYEEQEEQYEEQEEQYEEQQYENNYGGAYGGNTPTYEEEYEQGSYYGGYGNNTYEEASEEYQTPSYGYGGNPSYNNAANQTYTSEYEEAYGGNNGETETGSGSTPNVPFVPTSLLTGFVVDIHFLAGDPRFQYIAYHYCSDLYPGYTQCDIYNGSKPNSRLVATEIVVSAEIFAQLPMQERKLWHSHAFAVKSGLLVSPNTPADQELSVMASVMNSYGKVTDFWHSYQTFPYGGAKLAFGLGAESQINETIAEQLDSELGLSTTWQERAELRRSLNPTVIEGADDYLTSGEYPQYVTQSFPVVSGNTGETGETGESGESAVIVTPEEEDGGNNVEEAVGGENGEDLGGDSGENFGGDLGENSGGDNGENSGDNNGEDFGDSNEESGENSL